MKHLKDRGIGVLITDHNVRETLEIIHRAYIMHDGQVLMEGTPGEVVANKDVRRVYLASGSACNAASQDPAGLDAVVGRSYFVSTRKATPRNYTTPDAKPIDRSGPGPLIGTVWPSGPRLDLRQSQTLVMTPQLRQAIQLLQYSNIEVATFVEQELERNPLLERDEVSDAPIGRAGGT